MRDGDTNHDGALDFEEFSRYLQAHEKELKIMFSSLDRNKDGQLTLHITDAGAAENGFLGRVFLLLGFTFCFCSLFQSGKIDAAEIQHSLHTIGVNISLEEATRILQRSLSSFEVLSFWFVT